MLEHVRHTHMHTYAHICTIPHMQAMLATKLIHTPDTWLNNRHTSGALSTLTTWCSRGVSVIQPSVGCMCLLQNCLHVRDGTKVCAVYVLALSQDMNSRGQTLHKPFMDTYVNTRHILT